MTRHWAYYNEHDEYAAQWLRNLIAKGMIAPGYVDTRSISDVAPNDLWEFTQCHFFAGIGVWSYALRQVGWPDSRPVWTGSCPCQPFSTAGPQAGFDDERHLWPDFAWLIGQCNPPAVYGEQVASKAVQPWVDLVQDDLEEMGYAFASIPFPAASVGAPHIRDRMYWLADSGYSGLAGSSGLSPGWVSQTRTPSNRTVGVLGDTFGQGLEECFGHAGISGFATGTRPRQTIERASLHLGAGPAGSIGSFWSDADWLLCRDGKWRPVEPGTFPLATGAPARVGRLRAYGNALNAEAAKAFIEATM